MLVCTFHWNYMLTYFLNPYCSYYFTRLLFYYCWSLLYFEQFFMHLSINNLLVLTYLKVDFSVKHAVSIIQLFVLFALSIILWFYCQQILEICWNFNHYILATGFFSVEGNYTKFYPVFLCLLFKMWLMKNLWIFTGWQNK